MGRKTSVYLSGTDQQRIRALGDPPISEILHAGITALEQYVAGLGPTHRTNDSQQHDGGPIHVSHDSSQISHGGPAHSPDGSQQRNGGPPQN